MREDCLSCDEDDVDRKVVWIAWAIFYKIEEMSGYELYENSEITCRIFFDMLYNDFVVGWSIVYIRMKKRWVLLKYK